MQQVCDIELRICTNYISPQSFFFFFFVSKRNFIKDESAPEDTGSTQKDEKTKRAKKTRETRKKKHPQRPNHNRKPKAPQQKTNIPL